MIRLLPEPKRAVETGGFSKNFNALVIKPDEGLLQSGEILEIAKFRFWNHKEIDISLSSNGSEFELPVEIKYGLDNAEIPEKTGNSLFSRAMSC